METDPDLDELHYHQIQSANSGLLTRIIRLHQYLEIHLPDPTNDHPTYCFPEPGYKRNIEVSEDAFDGFSQSWDSRQATVLSPEQIETKLVSIHKHLMQKALQKAEQDILRDLAAQKLQEKGIY